MKSTMSNNNELVMSNDEADEKLHRQLRLVDLNPQFSNTDHFEKLTWEVHVKKLAHPNSKKVVFELLICEERVQNKLAMDMFTLYF
jgi:hypothetical protein